MTFLVASLGVYYLSYSISNPEIDGPWDAFKRLRGVWTDQHDWKARGVRCVVCVSCWAALLWSLQLLWMGSIVWSDVPIVWLGLAGGSVILARYWQR